MVPIGYRPVIWHVMRYYAHLRPSGVHPVPGPPRRRHQGVLPQLQRVHVERLHAVGGGRDVRLLKHDISDWTISFVDTGQMSNIGQR